MRWYGMISLINWTMSLLLQKHILFLVFPFYCISIFSGDHFLTWPFSHVTIFSRDHFLTLSFSHVAIFSRCHFHLSFALSFAPLSSFFFLNTVSKIKYTFIATKQEVGVVIILLYRLPLDFYQIKSNLITQITQITQIPRLPRSSTSRQ
jgi:hypothetical protein